MNQSLLVYFLSSSLYRREAWLALLIWIKEDSIDGILLGDLDGLVEALELTDPVKDICLQVPVDDEYGQSLYILEGLFECFEDCLC